MSHIGATDTAIVEPNTERLTSPADRADSLQPTPDPWHERNIAALAAGSVAFIGVLVLAIAVVVVSDNSTHGRVIHPEGTGSLSPRATRTAASPAPTTSTAVTPPTSTAVTPPATLAPPTVPQPTDTQSPTAPVTVDQGAVATPMPPYLPDPWSRWWHRPRRYLPGP